MSQYKPVSSSQARIAAMNLLARREHSRRELLQKLQTKIPIDIINPVLDQLEQDNLLSDSRYCEGRVRYRAAFGFGPLKIKAELMRAGVNEELIASYLHNDDSYWLPIIYKLVERKYAGKQNNELKVKAAQQRFLQQRGFTHAQIRTVLSS